MDANGDSVTLVVPAGIDLTFHFARTDRMYIDLPLLGPIYYQRKALGPATTPTATATQTAATTLVVIPPAPVIAAVTAARAASETPATPVAVIPADSPVIVASAATPALVSNAQQSFSRAVILAENNEADAALRQLDDALHEGFRDWAQLDANQALQTLRTDPRYGALMARWRIP
jgi:hypothetical protein